MLQSIDEKELKLEQQKAKLLQKAQALKSKARKIQVKKLIRLGQLVKSAELDELDEDVLYGALLALKEQLQNSSTVDHWRSLSQRKQPVHDRDAYALRFSEDVDAEIRSKLKALGFKWNPFRKEWQGYLNRNEMKQLRDVPAITIERIFAE